MRDELGNLLEKLVEEDNFPEDHFGQENGRFVVYYVL
jgi:hypothetical protein